MFRFPVSDAVCCGPPRPPPAGTSASPADSPSRNGCLFSVATTLPLKSHSSCTEPKFVTGTRYENGSVICVTRKNWPSGDASTARIMPGTPTFLALFVFTSISTTWPVV